MSGHSSHHHDHHDAAPGDETHGDLVAGVRNYLVGLFLATVLTVASFYFAASNLVYHPAIPVVLLVLAVAQMGVHLVFFLHIGTGPESVNNVMALAFGVLIVFLTIAGSVWIMAHMNHNMMSMDQMMQMER